MSLRELIWACEAKQKHDWDQTAPQLALHANIHRDKKERAQAFTIADFHPLLTKAPQRVAEAPITALKVFCK